MDKQERNLVHDFFLAAITVKGIDGLLQIIGGVALLFVRSETIARIVSFLFSHELAHDPADILANYIVNSSQNISAGALLFAAAYLLIHGTIKVGLFLGLWFEKVWAYPVAGIALSLLVIYQSIRIYLHHSAVLFILTSIDILIIILLRFEYNRHMRLLRSKKRRYG